MFSALAVDGPRGEIGGIVYAQVGHGNGTCFTRAGPVEVSRALFGLLGAGNAPTVDVISLRAGVGDGWLPQIARAMAQELRKAPSREGEHSGKETGRLPYSRASFERVPHEVGALYLQHRANIKDALIACLAIPICLHCRGPCKLLAFLTDQSVTRRILLYLNLPLDAPTIRPAQSPPQPALQLV